MLTVLFRTLILYLLVVITMRIMGKRQIGELQPYELVVTIMISELAALPMQDVQIPMIHGVIPIITLLMAQIIISEVQLKYEKARTIFSGKPSVLINDGKIVVKEMKVQRYSINDLMEELRLQGYLNISDIAYGILETNGQLSIIPKGNTVPPTRDDLKINFSSENLPVIIILDGKIKKNSLQFLGKNEQWLLALLKENNIASYSDLFLGLLDSSNKFFYQYKE